MRDDERGSAEARRARLTRRQLVRGAAVGAVARTVAGVARLSPVPALGAVAASAVLPSKTLVFALSDTDAAKVRPLVDDYAKRNNIAIQVEASPYASLLEKLTINLTQDTGAYDIVSMDDPWIPQFAGGGSLVNLREMMDKAGIRPDADFIPELLALGDFPAGSGLWAIPWLGNIQVFAWRSDTLRELGMTRPRSWDEVVEVAGAITRLKGARGFYGFGLRGQTGNPAATSFLPVLRGHGTDLFDETWEPQLETPAAIAAMATHLALAKLAPPGVETVGHDANGRNMYEGTIAQSGDIWPDQLLQIYDPAISKVAGKVEIGGEPAQAGVKPANMTGNWLLGIPDGSQYAEDALAFILWFTAAEQQRRLLLEYDMPATRTSVLEDAAAVAKLPFLPGLLAAARQALPRPRTPHYNAVETIVGRWVAGAIAGEIAGEEAMARANSEIRALMVREGVIEG
jgi:multiple sugar transport system substrate-binding protein